LSRRKPGARYTGGSVGALLFGLLDFLHDRLDAPGQDLCICHGRMVTHDSPHVRRWTYFQGRNRNRANLGFAERVRRYSDTP
jgi:hypothetical protein